jgi:hypothetical protein
MDGSVGSTATGRVCPKNSFVIPLRGTEVSGGGCRRGPHSTMLRRVDMLNSDVSTALLGDACDGPCDTEPADDADACEPRVPRCATTNTEAAPST